MEKFVKYRRLHNVENCSYNTESNEWINIHEMLVALPENERLAAYQNYVDLATEGTIIVRPCPQESHGNNDVEIEVAN